MSTTHTEVIRQSVLLARNGDANGALQLLLEQPVPESSPQAGHYHYTLGQLLLGARRPGEAFAHLDVAIHRDGITSERKSAWLNARTQAEGKLGAGALELASTPLEAVVDSPYFAPFEALLAVTALVLSFRSRPRNSLAKGSRSMLRWAGIAWLIAATAATAHYWGSQFPRTRAAVEITLRSGPAEEFISLGSISAGSELRLLDRRDGWVRVRATAQLSGWAPSSAVLLLKPPSNTPEP